MYKKENDQYIKSYKLLNIKFYKQREKLKQKYEKYIER